jgi:hypothetical protein
MAESRPGGPAACQRGRRFFFLTSDAIRLPWMKLRSSLGCLACLAILSIASDSRAQTRLVHDLPFAAPELNKALRLRLDGPACPEGSLRIEQVFPGTLEIRCRQQRRFLRLRRARGVAAARLVALAAAELSLESTGSTRAAEASGGQRAPWSWADDVDIAVLGTVETPVRAEMIDPYHLLAGVAVEGSGRTFAGLRGFAGVGVQRSIESSQRATQIALRAGLLMRTRWFDLRLGARGARYTLDEFEGDSTTPGWQVGLGGAVTWRPHLAERAVFLVSAGLDEHMIRTNRKSCCVADAITSDRTGWLALGFGW